MFEEEDFDQTFRAGRSSRRELPPFYYREHFLEMLDFLRQHYSHALQAQHREFLEHFQQLSLRSRALYVRLVNRKGRVFAVARLRYPEIGSVSELLEELRGAGLVGAPGVGGGAS